MRCITGQGHDKFTIFFLLITVQDYQKILSLPLPQQTDRTILCFIPTPCACVYSGSSCQDTAFGHRTNKPYTGTVVQSFHLKIGAITHVEKGEHDYASSNSQRMRVNMYQTLHLLCES